MKREVVKSIVWALIVTVLLGDYRCGIPKSLPVR